MSVTTTDNARVTQLRHVLADYDLHHGQPSDSDAAPAPAPNEHALPSDASVNAPPGYDRPWRRVPAYRPIVQQVDEQRNTYTSEVERNFVRVMFGGMFNCIHEVGSLPSAEVICQGFR